MNWLWWVVNYTHVEHRLRAATHSLATSTNRLRAALAAAGAYHSDAVDATAEHLMSKKTGLGDAGGQAVIDDLIQKVNDTEGVMDSAVAYIQGVPGLIQAGIDQALAGGVTKDELAPIQAKVDELKAKNDAITAAIQANSPPPAG